VKLAVDEESYWAPYYTAFPLLGDHLETEAPGDRAACVIGASDGKFVTPLLRLGWRVVAIELDDVFLDGGTITLKSGEVRITGLRQRLRDLALDRCEIVRQDYMVWPPTELFQLVTTSGLWSMPENRHHTLADLVRRQQGLVAKHGLLFADYLMATNAEERATGFCPEVDEVAEMFPRPEWQLLLNAEMGRLGESHLGWEEWHEHRYAAVIARRCADG
jgi:hypothetical protein